MPALRSTALIRWSKILSWNILTSISCQEEAASQSQFRQCIVLAEVFPTRKPNFRIKIHKTLQPFACWAVRWLTISSQSSAIKFFRIFSVWEILSSASLKPWKQKQVTRVPCLGIQISTCSWILNWINELMKSHPLPPSTVHELRYPSAREIYTHTHILSCTLRSAEAASVTNRDKIVSPSHSDLLTILWKTHHCQYMSTR